MNDINKVIGLSTILDALSVDEDREVVAKWLQTRHRVLGKSPLELIIEGNEAILLAYLKD